MKIVTETPPSISAKDMPKGKVAILVSAGSYVGELVQRVGDMLVLIGVNDYWSNINALESFRVRMLPEGTTIEV